MKNNIKEKNDRILNVVAKNEIAISIKDLNFFYGDFQALHNITMDILRYSVTAIIGPSGCGKSTFLRCLNRMNELLGKIIVKGEVNFGGMNIYSEKIEPVRIRRHIGMVFLSPNPFSKSVFDNVAYGPKMYGEGNRDRLHEIVETSLKRSAL